MLKTAPRDLLRALGAALLALLALVGVTGFLVLFGYVADPAEGPRRLANASTSYEFVRSLHLWGSRLLLVGAGLHAVLVWRARRGNPAWRRDYALGAALLAALGAAHLTGHVLRWDEGGRRLAEAERAFVGAESGDGGAAFLNLHVPLHAAVASGLVLVLTLLHVGVAHAGLWARMDRPTAALNRRAVVGGAALLVGVAALLALAAPAPSTPSNLPWPFAPFEYAAQALHATSALLASALLAWGLVATQPWLQRYPKTAAATRWGLLALAAATMLPAPR